MNFLLFLVVISTLLGDIRCKIGVFEVTPENEDQLSEIEKLSVSLNLKFWKGAMIRKASLFSADSDDNNIEKLEKAFSELNLKVKVLNKDFHRKIEDEHNDNEFQKAKSMFRSAGDSGIHTYFAGHVEITKWLFQLKHDYPKFVSLRSIGKSYEGRKMTVIKLSTGPGKKAIFMDGGIHAREWLGVSTVVYILNKIIDGYKSQDKDIEEILSKFDIYVLPVTNPDGYEFSRDPKGDRLWRKNREPSGNGCFGTDLNRNFDVDFGNVGISTDPCSEIFQGAKAFSAPETQNFRDFVLSIKNELRLFLTFHAYSQLVLTSWGYTQTPPDDEQEIMRIANLMVNAIEKTNGLKYVAGSPARILYPSSGGCDDWVKQKAGVKYSYTFEVRPTGDDENGFVVPVSYIKPTGEELYAAFVAAAKNVE